MTSKLLKLDIQQHAVSILTYTQTSQISQSVYHDEEVCQLWLLENHFEKKFYTLISTFFHLENF